MKRQLDIYKADAACVPGDIPVVGGFSAGFPSPAADYVGDRIDLNDVFIRDSGNTYFARVNGYYLLEGDLSPGDALLFDTSLRPRKGDLAVCNIDGEIVLKFIDRRERTCCLVDGADSREELLDADSTSYVMGIVTTLFVRRRSKGRRTLPRWGVRRKDEKPTVKRAIRWGYRPEDEMDTLGTVDLNRELIHHPVYAAYGLVVGESLREDAMDDGDSVLIDTVLDPIEGDLAVSYRHGEFMIKYVEVHDGRLWLVPGNREYEPVPISEEEDTRKLVWGIVTYSIKQLRKFDVRKTAPKI